ncbi:Intermembrane space import and assembly protein 40 [Tolypocladium paradoxum]|uniref:Mitochondrial intermembrane space import and assembly protein 40 n=1 Tax=Tolypocladium paradoxum TaxID=94208 RepID=A0A2S4KMJ9_9HYPO|nr:Intermembrane space import and assembly protein 40 [Tolypocladium paradoxum]
MYRAAVRSASRQALGGLPKGAVRVVPRRFASTASPADRPRSWKGSALRWGLAVGAVYYYSTSSVFADEASAQTIPAASFTESDLPTVDSVIEQKRKHIKANPTEPSENKQAAAAAPEKQPKAEAQNTVAVEGSSQALEEEAGQEGAFNPETGEINWDCPCLGGMAHGPCGEEFKTAFSCFVHSTEEPKGMDCIEKFQGMQECFRKYPEIYGAELSDDELAEDGVDGAGQAPAEEYQVARDEAPAAKETPEAHNSSGVTPVENPIPTKWEDATAANDEAAQAEDTEKESKPEEKDTKESKPEGEKGVKRTGDGA